MYDTPRGEFEASLAELWTFALRIDRVGRDDDFFELGGDSFGATVIATQIEQQFGIRFAPADIISNSTIALQAKLVSRIQQQSQPTRRSTCLIGCNTAGKLPPLFLIHGVNGFTFFNKDFFEKLGAEQPVYLFQARGLDGYERPLTQVEKIAEHYVIELQSVQPEGPYNIGAFCAGGLIGLEMCLQLSKQGQIVNNLLLIDPPVVPSRISHLYPAAIISKRNLGLLGIWMTCMKRFFTRVANLYAGRGFTLNTESASPKNGSRGSLKRQRRLLETIKSRRSSGKLFENELQYDPNVMIDASLELTSALQNYIPGTSYDGHAHFLVNSLWGGSTIRDDLFWKSHLGSLDYEMLPGNHKDFFGKNILLVADFVKRKINNSERSQSSPRLR